MADAPPRPRAPRAPRAPRVADTGTTDTTDTGGNGGNGGTPPPPPPRVASGPAAGAKPRTTRTPALEAKLQQFCAMPALAFAAAGDQYCAEVWSARSDMLAASWYELSKQNAGVRRVLEQLVEGSAWGGVVMSTLAISLPIAKHHGLYRGPDPFANFLPGPPAPPTPHGDGRTGGPAGGMQWTRDPAGGPVGASVPTPSSASSTRGDDDATPPAPIYLEGAPPGVVTVAASPAQHNGAR